MKSLNALFLVFLLSVSSSVFAAKVNINTANFDVLAVGITGIGESKAKAIVAYRKENGKFHSIDDLAKVKGVGVKTVEKNRHNISL